MGCLETVLSWLVEALTGDCLQWTSICPSCCLGSLLNRNWSKPWIAQYIAIHTGMSFTVKRLLRTAPKWHTSYLYFSPKTKLFHSKIFSFFSFSLFFSSVAVLFFCWKISWLLVSTASAPVILTVYGVWSRDVQNAKRLGLKKFAAV